MNTFRLKTLLLLILSCLMSPLQAQEVDEIALTEAVQARLALMQTEIEQLDRAITLMSQAMSERERYEQIAEHSFAATDASLQAYGYTLKSLYAFEAEHKEALEQWLAAHPQQATELESLQQTLDSLIIQFDQINAITQAE